MTSQFKPTPTPNPSPQGGGEHAEFAAEHALASAFLVLERHRVEFEPVVDQFVAELARDLRLQALDLLRLEFDHLAAAKIDEMVVMRLGLVS